VLEELIEYNVMDGLEIEEMVGVNRIYIKLMPG